MATPIRFEKFSTGLKARLNPTYRREVELHQGHRSIKPRKDFDQGNQTTALPFTTKTKAYGTYVWRRH
jgi:hypothetical protein